MPAEQTANPGGDSTVASLTPGGGRERLLLDFGWRFHFGHADDPSKDFGYGGSTWGNFQKTGNFMPAGAIAFDDSEWRSIDLPHDWAVELPFENDPDLVNKGFYPLREFFGTGDVRSLFRGRWGAWPGPCPGKVLRTQELRVNSCEHWS
jgi:hypothetical protein